MNTINESHALEIARALGDAVRFSIYRHIVEMEEVRCGDICVNSPVRASTVSHHLRMLAEAGLIESRREGQGVYYRWVPSKLDAYLKYFRKNAQKGKQRGPTQPNDKAIR
jgi:ArsR family transcriptional regulator, arsenate/arsenite/antimonite-responsive transcriptional repressor